MFVHVCLWSVCPRSILIFDSLLNFVVFVQPLSKMYYIPLISRVRGPYGKL